MDRELGLGLGLVGVVEHVQEMKGRIMQANMAQ